jgi:hypothetical protein
MKHDAVAWSNGTSTATRLLTQDTQDCSVCHLAPTGLPVTTWKSSRLGGATALYHASLDAAALAQPDTCLDCHANSRPDSAQVTSTALASVPLMIFDHATGTALSECAACHTRTSVWSGGRFHHEGAAASTSCSGCHLDQRPDRVPPDLVLALKGFDHALYPAVDCLVCHAATVTGGKYGRYDSPSSTASSRLLGGDWKDGIGVPSAVTSSVASDIPVTAVLLTWTGASVTSVAQPESLRMPMNHFSAQVSSTLLAQCGVCHASSTSLAGGRFHTSLAGLAPAAWPQPTSCGDCHRGD